MNIFVFNFQILKPKIINNKNNLNKQYKNTNININIIQHNKIYNKINIPYKKEKGFQLNFVFYCINSIHKIEQCKKISSYKSFQRVFMNFSANIFI